MIEYTGGTPVPPSAEVNWPPLASIRGFLSTSGPGAVERWMAGRRGAEVLAVDGIAVGAVVLAHGATLHRREDGSVLVHDGAQSGDDLERLGRLMDDPACSLRGVSGTAVAWSCKAGTLVLARLGASRPLHVRRLTEGIEWSTRSSDLIRPGDHIDRVGIGAFLAVGHLTGRQALVEGIEQVAPDETWLASPSGSVARSSVAAMWEHLPTDLGRAGRLEVIREEFTTALAGALGDARRPGLLLSGGIDSTMLAVGLSRYLQVRPTAFTVRFGDYRGQLDEFEAASMAAEALGIEHVPLRFDPEFVSNHINWMVRAFDDPFAIALHTAQLDGVVDAGCDVLFAGAGGDSWWPTPGARRGVRMAAVVPRRLLGAMLGVVDGLGGSRIRGSGRLRKDLRYASDLPTAIIAYGASHTDPRLARTLLGAEADRGTERMHHYYASRLEEMAELPPLLKVQLMWGFAIDPDHNAGWILKWSEAYGVRPAMPFLDKRLAAFLATHAIDVADRAEFRALAAEHVPEEAAYRAKIGQAVPLAEWFRGPLRRFVEEALDPAEVEKDGIFDPAGVTALVGDHMSGRADARLDLLKLVTIGRWKREVFDRAESSGNI